MAGEHWAYQVVDVEPGFLAGTRDATQDKPDPLGQQGRELVCVVQPQRFAPLQLYPNDPT